MADNNKLLTNSLLNRAFDEDTNTLRVSNVGSTSSGTVTSVDLTMPDDYLVTGNPITDEGTLAVSYASQTKNKVFASPDNIGGLPSFRTLVANDLPVHTHSIANITGLQTALNAIDNKVNLSGTETLANQLAVWEDADTIKGYAGLTFDGSVLKVGDIFNGDYTEIESDGTIVMYGDAITYDDQQVNLGEVAGGGWYGTPGVDIVEYRTGSALEFQNSTSDSYKSRFNVQLSHRYAEGENIEFHLHIGNDSSTSGNAVFKFTYEWANMEDTFSSSSSTTTTIAIDGTDGKHQMEEIILSITGTGKKISSILLCTLERLAGDSSDTFSESVYVIALDFHIPINTMGSRDIGVK